jgi:hypothetical protein
MPEDIPEPGRDIPLDEFDDPIFEPIERGEQVVDSGYEEATSGTVEPGTGEIKVGAIAALSVAETPPTEDVQMGVNPDEPTDSGEFAMVLNVPEEGQVQTTTTFSRGSGDAVRRAIAALTAADLRAR